MPARQTNITLGTAGHIDHGKTALIKCLTGCDTDRLEAEKQRGMSIELGFAPCAIADLEVGIVDVPGHENFIKTMVAGASGMDGVILVVAADDSVMPQTREHLEILTLLAVRHGLVAVTKIDRVERDHLQIVLSEVREFVKETFLDGTPILPLSNATGEGFGAFYDALAGLVRSMKPKPVDGVFRLPIERAFSLKGYGTVVSGIPVSGSARTGDEIVLLPQNLPGRIKAIQVYNRTSEAARAGQCAALNVRHWDHSLIKRGNVVTVPGYFSPEQWLICELRLLPHDKLFLTNAARIKFHTGTSELPATVYLMQGDRIQAGEQGFVQVKLSIPLIAGPGDRFIIRTLSPVQTVGGGTIIEAVPRRLKRNLPGIHQDLRERAAAVGQDERRVEHCVRKAEALAVTELDLAFCAKVPLNRVRDILAGLIAEDKVVDLAGGLYMHRETRDRTSQRILSSVAEYHRTAPESPGPAFEQLRQACNLDKSLLEGLLIILKQQGKLVERSHRLALPEYRETFSDQDRRLLDAIEALFTEKLFQPPAPEELSNKTGASREKVDRILRILVEHERLVPVAENLLFHRQAVDRARQTLVSFIGEQGKLESVRFKYLLDTTRKFAIPLLDYFDRTGVTVRVGNTRYLRG